MTVRPAAALAISVVLLLGSASAQGTATVRSADAAAFMGTWAFTMTEPAELKGSEQTLRIWDKGGTVAAHFQVGKFPGRDVTGILKDGDMLILTVSHAASPQMLENGAPIWNVIALTLDGDTLNAAHMFERSQTIKRGSGKKVK